MFYSYECRCEWYNVITQFYTLEAVIKQAYNDNRKGLAYPLFIKQDDTIIWEPPLECSIDDSLKALAKENGITIGEK